MNPVGQTLCYLILLASLILYTGCGTGTEEIDRLRAGFLAPPLEARPRALWDWVDGNFEKEEITREMEEALRMGMGGFDIWDVRSVVDEDSIMPAGPPFMSDEYVDAICYAINEAERLGLDLGLIIASGWNAGGDWTAPEHQTMGLFQSSKVVSGPGDILIKLPFPELPDKAGKEGREKTALIPRQENGLPVFYAEVAVLARKLKGDSKIISAREILDLSDLMDDQGELRWNIPEGKWKVTRYVCTNTGQPMISSTPNSTGPMIDHFSAEASEKHIRFFIEKLETGLGKPIGESGLSYLYTDSYEVRGQLWTPAMLEEFRERRGYDMIPFLPALDGYIVDDHNTTSRFLYDYRHVLSDLIIENHYTKTREICEEHGVGFVAEAAGPGWPIHNCPFESLKASGSLSFPRGEFWHLPDNSDFWRSMRASERGTHYLQDLQVIKGVASASHIYNQKYVEAEAFTGTHLWNEGPGDLKHSADRAFCEGLNRINFHTWPHTPKAAGTPGWVYAFGTLVNEHRIWWPMAKPWMEYLGRCSYLLQEGNFAGDVLFFYGDSAPNFVPPKHLIPGLDFGYDYDVTNTDILKNRLFVENGKLKLPHGPEYEILVLPDKIDIQPEILEKIRELVRAGATVVGPKPKRSNGLYDWQDRDKQVKDLAEELWANCDGETVFENPVGDGKMVWGKPLKEVLAERGTVQDFSFTGNVPETNLDFIHRKSADGNEIYFIRNTSGSAVFGTGKFRQTGQIAEYWNPLFGSMFEANYISDAGEQILLPLTLDPFGSVFIIFSGHSSGSRSTSILKDGNVIFPLEEGVSPDFIPFKLYQGGLVIMEEGDYQVIGPKTMNKPAHSVKPYEEYPIEGSWQVYFPESSGGPGSVQLDSLVYWNHSAEDAIRFFSGIATYEKEFTLSEECTGIDNSIWIEFDNIIEVASLTLNGQDMGILWNSPFRIDISDAVRAGKNHLSIKVANTWANGLCGDARLPAGERRTKSNVSRLPNAWTHRFENIPNPDYPLIESGIGGKVVIRNYHQIF